MVRALVAGESVDFGGATGSLRWSRRRVPILFAGDGPRVLRAAGATADGAIVGGSSTPEALDQSRRHVREGARAAGRDPAAAELWAFVKVSFGATAEEAIAPLRATLAAAAQRNFRRDPLGKGLPPALLPALESVVAGYTFGRHGDTDAGGNARLLTDPELTRFLADRFSIFGTPEQVRRRIRAIAEVGIDRLLIVCSGPDPDALLEALGAEIVRKVM